MIPDTTSAACLQFQLGDATAFESEFTGRSPMLDIQGGWHSMVHESSELSSPHTPALTKAFQHYGKLFTRLVQRLAEVKDVDGSRLLDNTLVLWVSDLNGPTHWVFDLPIVMAGLKDAFPQGQGRHVVAGRRSTGDFYAQILRMFGGSDTTFGQTGTLGGTGLSRDELRPEFGFPGNDTEGFVDTNRPLHVGAIDL